MRRYKGKNLKESVLVEGETFRTDMEDCQGSVLGPGKPFRITNAEIVVEVIAKEDMNNNNFISDECSRMDKEKLKQIIESEEMLRIK